jgi:hypothetical protein
MRLTVPMIAVALFVILGGCQNCRGLLCASSWKSSVHDRRPDKPLFCSAMSPLITPRIACAKRRDPHKNAECRQAYSQRVYNCR